MRCHFIWEWVISYEKGVISLQLFLSYSLNNWMLPALSLSLPLVIQKKVNKHHRTPESDRYTLIPAINTLLSLSHTFSLSRDSFRSAFASRRESHSNFTCVHRSSTAAHFSTRRRSRSRLICSNEPVEQNDILITMFSLHVGCRGKCKTAKDGLTSN